MFKFFGYPFRDSFSCLRYFQINLYDFILELNNLIITSNFDPMFKFSQIFIELNVLYLNPFEFSKVDH